MSVPSWFKIIWWIVLIGVVTLYLVCRYLDVVGETSSTVDAVMLITWIVLAFAPLFAEIDLLGFRLRREMDSLREDVDYRIRDVKAEIRANVHAEFNPQITIPVSQSTGVCEISSHNQSEKHLRADSCTGLEDDIIQLFVARCRIERELRRSFESWIMIRNVPLRKVIHVLVVLRQVTPELAVAIDQVLAICSAAIHGERVGPGDVQIVERVIPAIIGGLDVDRS